MQLELPQSCVIRTDRVHNLIADLSKVAHGLNLNKYRPSVFRAAMCCGCYPMFCVTNYLYPKLARPELPALIDRKIGYDYLALVAWEDDIDDETLVEVKWSLVAWESGTKQNYGWVNPSAIFGMKSFSFTDMLASGIIAPGLKFIRFAPIANAIADEDLEIVQDVDELETLPICQSVELFLLTEEEWTQARAVSWGDDYNEALF